MTKTVNALRQQLQQLEARLKDGRIDQATYDRERAPLERALLDQVMKQPAAEAGPATSATPADSAAARPRPSAPLLAGLLLGVLALAVAGYAFTGSPSLISGVPPAAPPVAANHENNAAQFAAAVEQLAEKLKGQPDNAEGWAMLARSYMQMDRTADALPAFQKALALAGDDPRLLVDYADALAVQNNRSLEGEPLKLIERALKVQPDNLKALALAGTAAFNRKDYPSAVKHWERMQRVAPADSPFMPQLTESIAEARQLGGMPPPAGAKGAPTAAAPALPGAGGEAGSTAAAAAGVTLRGSVKLAAALSAKAAPTDTVFIYARPAEGSRMPLAILRKQVRDLPLDFTLDDSLAMSPAGKLSAHPKVVLEARISKSGQAQAASGDLVARSAPLAHNAQGVVLEISETLP